MPSLASGWTRGRRQGPERQRALQSWSSDGPFGPLPTGRGSVRGANRSLDRTGQARRLARIVRAWTTASTGKEFTDRIGDVLVHMLMHSSQYRGEAAGFLNAAGHRVPDLDLIYWARFGEPKARPEDIGDCFVASYRLTSR